MKNSLVRMLTALVIANSSAFLFAGSATWLSSPSSGDWNTDANWMITSGTGYPNGPSDTATFATSNTTAITVSGNNVGATTVAEIIFNSGASAFTITANPAVTLTISGAGITNNSGTTQNFVAATAGSSSATIHFTNSATAGSNTSFTNNGGNGVAGSTQFSNTSTAGSANFINNGSPTSGPNGGRTEFFDNSSASNGTFTNNGSASGGGGFTQFFSSSSAGNGTFTTNGGTISNAAGGNTIFSNSATAGSGTFITNGGTAAGLNGGTVRFNDTSTAGSGTFTTNGGTAASANSGTIQFNNSSTAGTATFTNNGGTVSSGSAGFIAFSNSASAGSATFTNNGAVVSGAISSATQFQSTSTAGSAMLIANGGMGAGGSITFFNDATGGTATLDVRNNGTTPGKLDISFHNLPGLTIGSVEGSGNVFLGANNLTVGSNNLSKTFSGVIQDGGQNNGTGGSISKSGTGALTLSGANTYTGGTTVSAGALLVSNTTGSGTGTGSVSINSGAVLGGSGTISGPVTVTSGAALLGGKGITASGALTVANSLTLNSGSTIKLVLGASGTHSSLNRTGGTWTFASNQAFTFINGGAQAGVYNNIITGLAADPGTEGSWTITNPGFTGTFSYDGTGNIDLTLTAVHPLVAGADSQKTHAGAGTFAILLPLNGTRGIECRSGGATGDYQLLIAFTLNVVVNGNPQAAVTSGQGQVGTGGVGNGGTVTVSGVNVTVPLTNVTNAQAIAVTLFGVNDGTNTGDVTIPMAVLVGDTTGDGSVNSADISQTKSQSGHGVTSTNFREDVTADGSINSADISLVKSKSGTALPP